MKKIATLVVLVIMGFSMQAHAQAPKMMNYQGVARSANGQTLVNKQINLRLSIISADDVNDAVYKEEQLVTTNEFGLFAIKIGEGTALSGSMDAINWGSADHYISVEMDVDNNGHYAFMGTSQLLSVPYAFYAETAGKATNLENIDQMRSIDFTGTSGQTIRHNGSEWEASSTIYSDGTNVGIGTTSPTEKLDIDGSINLSTGGEITFDGDRALAMDASRNIMQGRQTGEALTSGVNNNMMGYRAGWKTTTGSNNSIIGYNAGYSNTTGSWNTMIGYKAGYSNTTGANNFYSGPTAGYGSTTGINNVAIGTGAGLNLGSANNNTFIGRNSGYNTKANENMFVGYEAGYNNISGTRNTYLGTGADGDTSLTNATAIGYNAYVASSNSVVLGDDANVGIGTNSPQDKLHVTGDIRVDSARIEFVNTGYSIFIGNDAGLNDDFTNNKNVGIGYSALTTNTTGQNNVAAGHNVLYSNTTGNNNIAFGSLGLYTNTTGSNNVGVGNAVLFDNTEGAYNVAVGGTAMTNNTTGDFNVGMGNAALFNNTTGDENVAIGATAMALNTSGASNSAFGDGALYSNSTGAYNTAVGSEALKGNTTYSNNTAIGYRAGDLASGSGSVFIGNQAGSTSSGDNKLYISNSDTNEPLIYGEFDNGLLTINGQLQVKDGTQADGYVLTSDSEGNATWEAPSFNSVATNVMTLQDGCTYNNAVLDASNTSFDATSSGTNVWQSFTATQSGYLDIIEVRFVSSFTGLTLHVYDGEGNTDTLGTLDFGGFYSSNWQSFDVSSLEIPLTVGEQYTFGFSTSHNVRLSAENPYAGGKISTGDDEDMTFRVYTRVCEDEVIALSADSTGVIVNGVDTLNFADGTYLTSSIIGSLADSDNDTKIQLEESSDEDVIRFDLGGTEFFRMDSGRFEFINTGLSVFIGGNAGSKDDLSSNYNVFIGQGAGRNNETGGWCTAVGALALETQTAGDYNNAFGSYSLNSSTSEANYNNAFGGGALEDNTTGDENTAVGDLALTNNTTGNNNTGLGSQVMRFMQTGSNNTAVGYQAGYNNSNGGSNVYIGYQSGKSASGSNKLYISNSDDSTPLIYGEFNNDWLKINGNLSASGGFTDDDNDTKIQVEESSDEDYIRFDVGGTEAMVIDQSANVGIGTSSPSDLLSVYGTTAGTGLTISTPRPVLTLEDTDANTWLIEMNAQALQFSEDGVGTAMTIEETTGYVGIGTTDPTNELDIETSDALTTVRVYNDSGDGTARLYVGASGGGHINLIANASGSDVYGIPTSLPGIATQYKDMVFATGTGGNNSTEKMRLTTGGNLGIGTTNPFYKLQVGDSGDGSQARGNAWLTFSDRRWKKDFEVIPNALSKLEQVNGYYYYWKEGPDTTQQVGVIAQEIEAILPQCVSTDEKGYKSVDYSKLSAWLIQVNKEQQEEINLLKTQLSEEKTNNQTRLERIEAELGIGLKTQR